MLIFMRGLITRVWGCIVLAVRNKISKTQDLRGSRETNDKTRKLEEASQSIYETTRILTIIIIYL